MASGEAAPSESGFVRPQVERRYLDYVQDHHGDIEVPNLCETMWSAGGREMAFGMTEYSDILPMIRTIHKRVGRIAELLERVLHEDRAYAWAMSNAMAEEQAIRADDDGQEALPF